MEYLGCELVSDWKTRVITVKQTANAELVLQTTGLLDCQCRAGALNHRGVGLPVKTPLIPCLLLLLKDCPTQVQRRYQAIVGYLSFVVHMTGFCWPRCNKGIMHGYPREGKQSCLDGWVDSDFAVDPNTHHSVSCDMVLMNC